MALYDQVLTFLNRRGIRGKDRLFGLLSKLGFRPHLVFNARYGIRLNLDPYEYIDSVILKEDFYESEVTEAILDGLGAGDTFWDIGANIGIHSLAVKNKRPGVTVLSFEPNPKVLSLLYNNARLNALEIQICAFALYEKADIMTLHIVDGNSGMSTLETWEGLRSGYQTKCLTINGDALIENGFAVPTVMKLDTEGAELSVLKGLTKTLANPELKKILFEAGEDIMHEPPTNGIAILLKQYGFDQINALTRNEHTHHPLSNFVAERSTSPPPAEL